MLGQVITHQLGAFAVVRADEGNIEVFAFQHARVQAVIDVDDLDAGIDGTPWFVSYQDRAIRTPYRDPMLMAEALFKAWAPENNHDYELRHKAIIDRFGRYPHRNQILGRPSSDEELAFLREPGSSF